MSTNWKNIVKMSIISKAIYRFNAIPNKIPMEFFIQVEKTLLKCIWKQNWPQIALTLSYSKARIMKTVQYWHKNRKRDQWNRSESPEINLGKSVNKYLIKEPRLLNEKRTVSSKNGAGISGYLHVNIFTCKRRNLDSSLIPVTKIKEMD